MDIGVHVFFSGKVQGVGFRFTTRRFAQKLGITGWVRNLDDGRVEMLAEGDSDKITDLLRSLSNEFDISDQDMEENEVTGEFDDFVIRH